MGVSTPAQMRTWHWSLLPEHPPCWRRIRFSANDAGCPVALLRCCLVGCLIGGAGDVAAVMQNGLRRGGSVPPGRRDGAARGAVVLGALEEDGGREMGRELLAALRGAPQAMDYAGVDSLCARAAGRREGGVPRIGPRTPWPRYWSVPGHDSQSAPRRVKTVEVRQDAPLVLRGQACRARPLA